MLNLEGDAVLSRLGGSTRPGPPACTLLGAGPGVPPHESPVPALSTRPLKLPGEGAAVVRPGVGTPPWGQRAEPGSGSTLTGLGA